jgi:hypothetical protein
VPAPEELRPSHGIPYGVALAAGFVWVLYTGMGK